MIIQTWSELHNSGNYGKLNKFTKKVEIYRSNDLIKIINLKRKKTLKKNYFIEK